MIKTLGYKENKKSNHDLEEIFVRDVSNKRLLCKIYEELLNLNNKKKT